MSAYREKASPEAPAIDGAELLRRWEAAFEGDGPDTPPEQQRLSFPKWVRRNYDVLGEVAP